MTNQLRSPVLFDTNILFVYISLVTAQIKEVSPEKNTSSSGHFTNCPPPLHAFWSPLHTDWATFSLWKRCENHFGQEKKLTGHLLQRLPVIEGAALAARLSWWRRDSDLTLNININLWHNEYEIFKPRLCSVIFFINPPKRFQEWKVHIEIEIEGRLTCALSRSELRYLPPGLLKVQDWSCD